MKTPVFTFQGEEKGSVELKDAIFARKWNNDLVYQVFTSLMANARRPWAHTKDRSEVRGGGIKPWRQKGTGRARHGSNRSPIWIGGGVTHGPRKDKDYSQKINKKMKTAALHTVLSRKLADGELRVIEDMKLADKKTKELSENLKNFYKDQKTMPSILLIPAKDNKGMKTASKNLKKVEAKPSAQMSVRDLLTHKDIFIEKAAIEEIHE